MSLGLTEHNGQEVVTFINFIIIIIIIFGPPAQSRRYEQKQRPRRVSLVSLSLKTSYRIVTKTTRRRCGAVVTSLQFWRRYERHDLHDMHYATSPAITQDDGPAELLVLHTTLCVWSYGGLQPFVKTKTDICSSDSLPVPLPARLSASAANSGATVHNKPDRHQTLAGHQSTTAAVPTFNRR